MAQLKSQKINAHTHTNTKGGTDMCEFISPHQLCISLLLLLLLPEWAHQSEAQTNPTRSRSLLFYAICCHWQLTFKCHCRHMFIALKSLSNLCRPHSHCRQPFNNCRSVFHFCHTSKTLLLFLFLLCYYCSFFSHSFFLCVTTVIVTSV